MTDLSQIVSRRRIESALRQLAAHPHARSQLPMIREAAITRDGTGNISDRWMRGVDFYSESQLARVMTRVFAQFHIAHSRYPNLIEPRGFNEWVIRSNFLRPMKVPESGNKLLTPSFIPSRLQGEISGPTIVWSGAELNWDAPDRFASGQSYYLKASHGSSMCARFTWPLDKSEQLKLSKIGARWLGVQYGLKNGEWWYGTFPPLLLIEKDVGGNGFSVNCFCFRGKVGLVVLHSKATGETITLGPLLDFVGQKHGHSDWSTLFKKSVLRQLCELAGELSREIEFARFDFLVDTSDRAFLGEVTFAPGGGTSNRPSGVDRRLGEMWSASAAF